MVDIPASAFVPVNGQQNTSLVQLKPPQQGLVAPPPVSTTFLTDIKAAVADNASAILPGHTALPPPDNFNFTDLSVNVSGTITGDGFKGDTTGVTSQFIDLTPDNLLIRALTPNTFMRADTGNDLLLSGGGRTIMSGGSGSNAFLAGSGHDTGLADATANTSNLVLNFGSGDDFALLNVSAADFKFSVNDTLSGLEIDAVSTTKGTAASVTLAGHSISEIGSSLSLGLSQSASGQNFLFVHAT